MVKGFREGMSKEQLAKSMTDADWERVREAKEFGTIKANTLSWKIALANDQIFLKKKQIEALIFKRLWNIENIRNQLDNFKKQLFSGQIKETQKDGQVLTDTELKTMIKHTEWLQKGEADSVAQILGELRGIVGHTDIAGNIVITEDQFDKYVLETEKELKNYGFKLF